MNETTSVLPVNTSSTESQSMGRDEDNVTSFSPLLRDVSGVLWQTVPPLLLLVGSVGNVMTMVVMRAMRASQSTACIAVYFTALAVSDLGLLTSSVCLYWMVFQVPDIMHSHVLLCTVPLYVCYVSSMTSAWLLVVMYQRVTSVVLPHLVGVLCTVRRGKIIIAGIVTVALVLNMHMLLNYGMTDVGKDYDVCQSMDENLASIFLLVDLSLASVIPFLLLLIGNAVLIRRVIESKHFSQKTTIRTEKQTMSRSVKHISSLTVTLILTSLAFCLLTLPTCIADVYLEAVGFYRGEIDDQYRYATLTLMETLSVLLWISNSAVNFYIYILSGSKFREEAKRRLCLMCLPTKVRGCFDVRVQALIPVVCVQ